MGVRNFASILNISSALQQNKEVNMSPNNPNNCDGILDLESFSTLPQKATMLHSSVTARIADNPKSGRKISRVLVIYTGGTIGMKEDPLKGYVVVPNFFASALKKLPMMYDQEYDENCAQGALEDDDVPYMNYPRLVMPESKMGVRIFYYIKEHNPILDSSNMCMGNWLSIANDIRDHYQSFDAFVILHGTDTLSYTASALSFMLENLDKTVVVTGSQIPIFEQRNDARSNFIGALVIAGHFIIPEVTVFFNNKLLRGNRSQKISASDLDAFGSPNLPPLARLGTEIEVAWDAVFPKTSMDSLQVHANMNENVGILRIFPGINAQIVRAFLSPPIEGIVIESFGAGNLPSNRPDLMEEFRKASESGVLLLNITQCYRGSVSDAYAAGRVLHDLGVVPGYDMTPEAALTKMAYVLGKTNLTADEKKEMLMTNLRGEMTVKSKEKAYNIKDGEFVQAVAKTLRVSSEKEMGLVRSALLPVLLTCAAKGGDLPTIRLLVEQGANVNEPSDYDGKTCLHLACAEGHLEVAKYLLQQGASVYIRDRRGRTPLFDAIRNKHPEIVRLLTHVGAHFQHDEIEVAREICIAAKENDMERLRLWKMTKVDMNVADLDGRTPLHVAVLKGNIEVVRFLVQEMGVNVNKVDIFGQKPVESALQMGAFDIAQLLSDRNSPTKRSMMNGSLLL